MFVFPVPLASLQYSVKKVILTMLSISWNPKYLTSKLKELLQRAFTITFPLYLWLVCTILSKVFAEWCDFASRHEVKIIQYQYGDFNKCVTMNDTSKEVWMSAVNERVNVTNLRNYWSEVSSHYKSWFLIVASIVFLLIHLIEALTVNPNNSLQLFVFGYNPSECSENSCSISKEEIPMHDFEEVPTDEVANEIPEVPCRTCFTLYQIAMSLIGLSCLVFLVNLPSMFYLLVKDSQQGKSILQ